MRNWLGISMWLHAKSYSLFIEPLQSVRYKGKNLDKLYFVQFPPTEEKKIWHVYTCEWTLLSMAENFCFGWVFMRTDFPFRDVTREITGGLLFRLCTFPMLFSFHRCPLPVPNNLVDLRIRPLVLHFHAASWESLYNGMLFPSLNFTRKRLWIT